MHRRIAFLVVVFGLLQPFLVFAQNTTWQAGVAKVNITPKERMWMSGYAGRNKPAEGKLTDLWAKALVLQDKAGKRHVLITLDLIGMPRDLGVPVCKKLKEQFGLPRHAVILSTSHTHTGPVVRSNLNAMYNLTNYEQNLITEYGNKLEKDLVAIVGKALKNLQPVQVSWQTGNSAFAVNRRNNKESLVPGLQKAGKLKGPFDHDVPVLAVNDNNGKLLAVAFGYACHATVLDFYQWSGDYCGFAQIYLEQRHPGAVAMFWAGCGGDQNPLPRRKVTLAMKYGKELADAVDRVLGKKMTPVTNAIRSSFREIDLPFSELPTREKLAKDALTGNRYVAGRAMLLLKRIAKQGKLSGTYPFPVQVWKLGGGPAWVTLGGEVVVDYSLRLKKELGPGKTWVMGYANDVMAYIPSLRVLKEGGYEGATSMVYYGQPTVWDPRIEELIVAEVHRQAKSVAGVQKWR